MTATAIIHEQAIWRLLEQVYDPEVPVLSVVDLGIIRGLSVSGDKVTVTITPTYSGCPAMDVISMQIRMVLAQNGVKEVAIQTVLSPSWTTDWMSDEGKRKLQAYGVAPPQYKNREQNAAFFAEEAAVKCPHCQSLNTREISRFGSTACKALYQCYDCNEPFDYFKCH